MDEQIFYNFKPVIRKFKTVWVEDVCECGCNKIIQVKEADDENKYYCYNCGKRIEKGR